MKVSSNGLEENSLNWDVEIIPNPAKDEFLLLIATENIEYGLLTIYKPDGQKMNEIKIFNPQTKINLRSFTSGIYLLQIQINGNSYTKRLIKN